MRNLPENGLQAIVNGIVATEVPRRHAPQVAEVILTLQSQLVELYRIETPKNFRGFVRTTARSVRKALRTGKFMAQSEAPPDPDLLQDLGL